MGDHEEGILGSVQKVGTRGWLPMGMGFPSGVPAVAMIKYSNQSNFREKRVYFAQSSKLQSIMVGKSLKQDPERAGHITSIHSQEAESHGCRPLLSPLKQEGSGERAHSPHKGAKQQSAKNLSPSWALA